MGISIPVPFPYSLWEVTSLPNGAGSFARVEWQWPFGCAPPPDGAVDRRIGLSTSECTKVLHAVEPGSGASHRRPAPGRVWTRIVCLFVWVIFVFFFVWFRVSVTVTVQSLTYSHRIVSFEPAKSGRGQRVRTSPASRMGGTNSKEVTSVSICAILV